MSAVPVVLGPPPSPLTHLYYSFYLLNTLLSYARPSSSVPQFTVVSPIFPQFVFFSIHWDEIRALSPFWFVVFFYYAATTREILACCCGALSVFMVFTSHVRYLASRAVAPQPNVISVRLGVRLECEGSYLFSSNEGHRYITSYFIIHIYFPVFTVLRTLLSCTNNFPGLDGAATFSFSWIPQ